MKEYGKIINSGCNEYIDELLRSGASPREIHTRLVSEKGISISHTYIADYAKARDIGQDKNSLPPIVGIDADKLSEHAKTLTQGQICKLVVNHSSYQALSLLEKSKNGTLTQQDLSLSKNLMDVLGKILVFQEFNSNKEVSEIEQGFNESEVIDE